jgi:hypothetical protein
MNKTYNGNIKDNLDVSHLNAGIYFVIVRGDDFNIARKVIVTK